MNLSLRILLFISTLLPIAAQSELVIYRGGLIRDKIFPPVAEFRILGIRNAKNVEVVHFINPTCRASLYFNYIDRQKLPKDIFRGCSKGPEDYEAVSRDFVNRPSTIIYVPSVGRLQINSRPYIEIKPLSRDWLLQPKITLSSSDLSVKLCFQVPAQRGGAACKKTNISRQDPSRIYFLPEKIDILNRVLINYKEVSNSFGNSEADLKKEGIDFGSDFLKPLNYKKKLCDGAIVKKVPLKVSFENEEKSSFEVVAAYTFCSDSKKKDNAKEISASLKIGSELRELIIEDK